MTLDVYGGVTGDWFGSYNGYVCECWVGKSDFYGKKEGMKRDFCGVECWC